MKVAVGGGPSRDSLVTGRAGKCLDHSCESGMGGLERGQDADHRFMASGSGTSSSWTRLWNCPALTHMPEMRALRARIHALSCMPLSVAAIVGQFKLVVHIRGTPNKRVSQGRGNPALSLRRADYRRYARPAQQAVRPGYPRLTARHVRSVRHWSLSVSKPGPFKRGQRRPRPGRIACRRGYPHFHSPGRPQPGRR